MGPCQYVHTLHKAGQEALVNQHLGDNGTSQSKISPILQYQFLKVIELSDLKIGRHSCLPPLFAHQPNPTITL
jgi:hypothetical protein